MLVEEAPSVFDDECSGKPWVGLMGEPGTGWWQLKSRYKVLCCCWWSDVECCGERWVVTLECRAELWWAQSSEQPCHPQESRANQRPGLRSRDLSRPMGASRGRAGATEAGPLADLRPTHDTVSCGPRTRVERHQWGQRRQRGHQHQTVSSDQHQWHLARPGSNHPASVGGNRAHIGGVYREEGKKDKRYKDLTFYKLIFLINLLRCQWSFLRYLWPS